MELDKIKRILQKIDNISKREKEPIFLVGGLVRDLLLQKKLQFRNIVDIDFTLEGKVEKFAKKISSAFNSKIIVLDKRFTTIRIVIKEEDEIYYQLDFSSFKGRNIKEDLKNRDFTVNAFAIEVGRFLELRKLFDLYNNVIFPPRGKESLKQKKIVPVSPSAFREDPLRLIRAFSIGAYLNFDIPPEILQEIFKQKELLENVAAERIRDELFRLFAVENSYKYIKLMGKCEILDIIFPDLVDCKGEEQGPYHCMDIYWHSIECIKKLEDFLPHLFENGYLKPRIVNYLNQNITGHRRRKELLKLALLLHDVGKPEVKKVEGGKIKFWGHENIGKNIVQDISEKLKLANSEKKDLADMVYYHLRPGNLVEEKKPTDRAIFRFFRHAGENTPAVILLSVADKYATAGELVSEESMTNHKNFLMKLLKRYFRVQEKVEPKKLVDGNDVMEILHLEPSPKVGKILKEIKLLQMKGDLEIREDALQYIKELKEN